MHSTVSLNIVFISIFICNFRIEKRVNYLDTVDSVIVFAKPIKQMITTYNIFSKKLPVTFARVAAIRK